MGLYEVLGFALFVIGYPFYWVLVHVVINRIMRSDL